MTSFGPNLHVFVIRARREPREIPAVSPEWRFWVEHHPGGEQRNFSDFPAVLAYVGLYLTDLELPTGSESGDR
jgi:hypothetical protein